VCQLQMSPRPPVAVGKGHSLNSGWGWCVVAASFVIHTIVGGIAYSGAVWLMILQRYFDCSQYETAWLGAILLAVATLGGECFDEPCTSSFLHIVFAVNFCYWNFHEQNK